MIAVDTSALMAILLDEPQADACMAALEAADEILISAGTVAESLIVAGRRNVGDEMANLIDGIGANVIALTQTSAERVARTYARWGKGIHPAGLNLADCFAYDVAKEHACALLYVGNEFARTDIDKAI
ncbi:type II toxin-antitoxin system VapC family toxin [Bradyrhizobium liaoningense]|uniref:type II toxin-antitoxin system VapC family toxin n=1 Tax=Bradyrhizobium liaoningense TaxID=43992 RepID=UPI001BACDA3B|nr:type II toxin-antitoxin system VapC family toxin [Bradyrhizobium liaoningense]MBR0715601.1 type II toxin-antitoxin system VapC family toxin [Bradyrhizobium liaoningense]